MVRAGEASGLAGGRSSSGWASSRRSRDELRGYIISSMIYPALLSVVGFGSIFVLLNFVVPRFATVFAESRMKMPLPTQIMLDRQRRRAGVRPWVAAVGWCWRWLRSASTSRPTTAGCWWDAFRLRLPLLGDALRKAETARFARAMGTLVANGVPLVQSLNIARGIMNNRRMADSLELVAQGVKRGEGLPARSAGPGCSRRSPRTC